MAERRLAAGVVRFLGWSRQAIAAVSSAVRVAAYAAVSGLRGAVAVPVVG